MSGKEALSLDEFVTAPRRQRLAGTQTPARVEIERPAGTGTASQAAVETEGETGQAFGEASRALRQMKRARMKGASHFVNVNLDRETKRRLKLASFNLDTSMQAIMEKAIRQYLDANGH